MYRLFSFAAIGLFLFPSACWSQARLNVTLTGLQARGTIYLAVYNTADEFGKPEKAFRKIVIKPGGLQTTVTADNLPSGAYAVAVYQDLYDNRKIDKNIFGIPSEPFAFSNNVRPFVTAPTFTQCLIKLDKPEHAISIKLMTYF
ncbi:MAG: DUF2141 domain-containing protein [Taibaiella sp.]|nr:DUF2141 domain-containing protein [Taibaiella sp.]